MLHAIWKLSVSAFWLGLLLYVALRALYEALTLTCEMFLNLKQPLICPLEGGQERAHVETARHKIKI